jgi:hypothetical protein
MCFLCLTGLALGTAFIYGKSKCDKKVIRMGDDILQTSKHIDIAVPGDKEKIAKNGTK